MEIILTNRQRRHRIGIAALRRSAAAAFSACEGESADGRFALRQLARIEITILSDAAIARVHRDFMGDPAPTDVITFHHGEILISADTAARCAAEHGHTLAEELALYIIHGMLHLNGHDDIASASRRAMHRVQNRIWRKVTAASA